MNSHPHLKSHCLLVTGGSGSLAQVVVKKIAKTSPQTSIITVDPRPKPRSFQKLKNVTHYQTKYSRTSLEEIFSTHAFDSVIHLTRFSHLNINPFFKAEKKLDLDILKTGQFLSLCSKKKIKQAILLSTFHVYGALPENPIFIDEEQPLQASVQFSELREVVEIDHAFSSWAWKHQNTINTQVLRPCHIVGQRMHNTISFYLKSYLAPVLMDFNPMIQMIHEEDMSSVMIACLMQPHTDIYNIAGNEVMSLKKIKETIHNKKSIQMPSFFLEWTTDKLPLFSLPKYLVNFIKYSSIIDTSKFKKHFPNFNFEYNFEAILQQLKKSNDTLLPILKKRNLSKSSK